MWSENVQSLNRYINKTPVVLKEGSLAELTITLASLLEGGGEIALHGLDLKCTSVSEDSMVFYDAVESSLLDGSVGRFAKNFVADLRIDEFRDAEICDSEINKSESHDGDKNVASSSGVDLLEQAIGALLGKFNLVMTETKITLQGPQNYQMLAINVPRIEACQTAGLAELFIEAMEGFNVKLLNRERERVIVSMTRPFPVSINFTNFLISAKNSALLIDITPDDVVLLREFARIYKSQGFGTDIRQQFGLDLMVKNPVILLSSSLELTTASLHLKMGKELSFEIDKAEIRYNDEPILVCPSVRKSLPSKLEFSKISISKHPKVLLPLFDSYKAVLNSSKHATSFTTYLKIDEIEFDNEHTVKMTEIEVNMDSRQWAMHVGKFTAAVNATRIECSRVSIFRSIRGSRADDAVVVDANSTGNTNSPCGTKASSLHSPFAEMATVIEGSLFVGVVAVPEEYFLLRSRLIEDSNVHYHISADQVNIRGSAMAELDGLLSQVVTEGNKQKVCYTASILHMSLTEAHVTAVAEGIEAIQFSSNMGSVTDLRMDLIELSTETMPLVKRALTVSLDPHFKPLVISNRKTLGEAEWSMCLSGAIISIPIYDDLFQTLWKQFPFSSAAASETITKWNVQLSLCSIQTKLPGAYQEKIAPHTLYMDKARLICDDKEPLLLFLQRGEVFFAPGPGLVMPVTGLFDEGHNYWEEQNYEALCKFDFLPISLTRTDGFWQIRVENNMITVDLFKDSVTTVTECANLYLQLVRDQRIKEYPSPSTDSCVDKEDGKMSSVLECIYEMDLEGDFGGNGFSASQVVDSNLNLEKNSLDLEEEYYSYGGMDSIPDDDLEGMIELPLPESLVAEETADAPKTAEGENLNFDDDFFATKVEDEEVHFPFSESQDEILARVQIADFSIAIRMHSGRQWSPNRSSHVGTRQETQFTPEFRERRSTLSSSASSRWSNLGGSSKTSSFRTIPKDDSVEFVIRGLNAELDWSNPFPPELVAPDMILAAMRMSVKKVEIMDHVRSSRWKTFLTRRIAKGETGPMIQLKVEMNFVEREEHKLLPEDQLEATIKLDVEPLRLHIDQDTLLFMLRFLDSKPTRRDVRPMFFGLPYNCD
ncbi:hypothetical protein PSACC_03199 [Paramicrosporidium saccamoebae]|uniref:Autophagy-related protein 2 n=1 Tax=Paramicrosporidium saccamoebae TaxID=1246581 RepID=A0A2H9TGR1_9FUNG|nr:hypothetical protein PSACC_03199 [Paramicrosporidium saccamoebae]